MGDGRVRGSSRVEGQMAGEVKECGDVNRDERNDVKKVRNEERRDWGSEILIVFA